MKQIVRSIRRFLGLTWHVRFHFEAGRGCTLRSWVDFPQTAGDTGEPS